MSYRVLIQTARVPHFTRCSPVFFTRFEAALYANLLRRRWTFIEAARIEEADGMANAKWAIHDRRFRWIQDVDDDA